MTSSTNASREDRVLSVSDPNHLPSTQSSLAPRGGRKELAAGAPAGADSPSRRHCRIRPPEDMFFSASISLKFRELAKTSTSTMAISRLRKVTAVSADMPCVTSMFSSSVFKEKVEGSLTLGSALRAHTQHRGRAVQCSRCTLRTHAS